MDAEMARVFGPALLAAPTGVEANASASSVVTALPAGGGEGLGGARDAASESVKDGEPTRKADTVPMMELARFVTDSFRVNADHRRTCDAQGRCVESRLADAIMAQTCSFSSDQVAKLVAAGVPPRSFVPLTATKIRAASSMLTAILSYGTEALATLQPSPDPEAPEEVVEEAVAAVSAEVSQLFSNLEQAGVDGLDAQSEVALSGIVRKAAENAVDAAANRRDADARMRCKRLERKVNDIMKEGRLDEAFHAFKNNVCTYGTGVIAFTVKNVPRNVSTFDRKSGVRKIVRRVVTIPVYESISPVDCYPAPNAVNVGDGALCVRMRYQGDELHRYASAARRGDVEFGSEGWRASAVAEVLARHPTGGVHVDEDRKPVEIGLAERNGVESQFDCTYEGIRCFAAVKGSMLLEMGISRTVLGKQVKAGDFYRIEAVVIDGTVVYCRIYDDRMGVPLVKGTFYDLPGSWWGESIADKLANCQSMCNNAVKAILQNMGMAAVPQVWMNDLARFQDRSGTGLKVMGGKLWTFSSGGGYAAMGQASAGVPMGVLPVPSYANELLAVFTAFNKQADLDSGIAAWSEGTGGGGSGALRTAEGLKTFMESQNRGMQDVVNRIDINLIRPLYRMTADWVMLYGKDVSLRGDVEVVPVGLMGRILKAQSEQARLQMFSMVLNSELLQQIAGIRGVVELWRPSLKDLDINPDNVCPSEERMDYLEKLQQIQQIFQATSASAGVAENAGDGAGAPPGVDQPPEPKGPGGGVAERRAAA